MTHTIKTFIILLGLLTQTFAIFTKKGEEWEFRNKKHYRERYPSLQVGLGADISDAYAGGFHFQSKIGVSFDYRTTYKDDDDYRTFEMIFTPTFGYQQQNEAEFKNRMASVGGELTNASFMNGHKFMGVTGDILFGKYDQLFQIGCRGGLVFYVPNSLSMIGMEVAYQNFGYEQVQVVFNLDIGSFLYWGIGISAWAKGFSG